MDLTNTLLIIQLVSTCVFTLIAWALKNVIAENIEPIKNDIKAVSEDLHEMKEFLREHRNDSHPHPNFEGSLENKYMTKVELEARLDSLDNRIEWRNHGK